MNLVSLIMQFLAPTIINKLASSLGLGQGIAGKAIAAAIPAILAGLAGTASKPGGATQLANAVSKQDGGLLGNFANMLGGGGQQSMIDSGSNVLSSLLGGSQTGALAGALSKFAGMNDGQSKSLLGALAPVVLGTLAKEQKASGLDAGGLANLLMGQKDNIASAMPAGFSNLLQGSGLLDGISGAAHRPAAQTTTATARPVEVSEPASSGMGILKYLIPLALAAGLIYMFAGRGMDKSDVKTVAPVPAKVEKAPTAAAPAEKAAAPAEKAAMPAAPAVPGVDLTGQANGAIEALKNALAGIKDEASAKASLPKLQDIAAQIDKLKGTAMALPADARHPLAVMIAGVMPGVASMIDKALAMPGVGAVLKPVLDQIAGSLGAVAKG